jgi:N-acetylmuramoyl-L-alanine amidase
MDEQRLRRVNTCFFRLWLLVMLVVGGLTAIYFSQGGWDTLRTSRVLARLLPGEVIPGPQVALIAGHRGFDSGAVCDDGVIEALVNEEVTDRVAQLLTREGVAVEVLDEYDPRLEGLHVQALVSIHADSCIDQSGFKIASAEQTVIPEADALLVDCLRRSYAEATGLRFRASAITKDMTQYHAFQRVADDTPGAIIETGYLGGDKKLLVEDPDRVAQGIAAGILCFLDAQSRAATPESTP